MEGVVYHKTGFCNIFVQVLFMFLNMGKLVLILVSSNQMKIGIFQEISLLQNGFGLYIFVTVGSFYTHMISFQEKLVLLIKISVTSFTHYL